MDDVYSKDFSLYVGSDFEEIINFSQIYVDNSETGNYTLSAGMKLSSDTTEGHLITAEVVSDTLNQEFTLKKTAASTILISTYGDYNYAVDLTDEDSGNITTILTGTITVKEDMSDV